MLSKAIKPDLTIDKASDLDEQEIEKIKKKYGIDRNIEEERYSTRLKKYKQKMFFMI